MAGIIRIETGDPELTACIRVGDLLDSMSDTFKSVLVFELRTGTKIELPTRVSSMVAEAVRAGRVPRVRLIEVTPTVENLPDETTLR